MEGLELDVPGNAARLDDHIIAGVIDLPMGYGEIELPFTTIAGRQSPAEAGAGGYSHVSRNG